MKGIGTGGRELFTYNTGLVYANMFLLPPPPQHMNSVAEQILDATVNFNFAAVINVKIIQCPIPSHALPHLPTRSNILQVQVVPSSLGLPLVV